MKPLLKTLFVLYLLALLWLVLFKTSLDIPSVFAVHIQKINLVPFAGITQDYRGMIDNIVVFIPLGLLVAANFTHVRFRHKLAAIAALSIAVEVVQFVFAIGVTDITDVITNVTGGYIGLYVYKISTQKADATTVDSIIAVICMALLAIVCFLRFFVFRVRY